MKKWLVNSWALFVEKGDKIKAGDILLKYLDQSKQVISQVVYLVPELFEARNPSNPAVVAEIDGIVFGKIKEEIVKSIGKSRYKKIWFLYQTNLVQEQDFVKSGTPYLMVQSLHLIIYLLMV